MRFLRALIFAVFILFSYNIVKADDQPLPMNILAIDVDSENIYALAYTLDAGARVRVYSKETNELVTEIDISDEIAYDLKISGDKLYVSSFDGKVYIISLEPEISLSYIFNVSEPSITWMDVDDRYLYIQRTTGNAKVWDISDFSLVKELDNTSRKMFIFEADENSLYGALLDRTLLKGYLKVWNKSDWSVSTFQITPEQGGIVSVDGITVDDEFVYTAVSRGEYVNLMYNLNGTFLEVWNKSDFTVHSNLTITDPMKTIRYLTSDSRYLYAVVPSYESEVRVYSKPDLELVETITYDSYEIIGSAAAYDNMLFTSSYNGTIKIWDTSDFSLVSSIGEPIEILLSQTALDIIRPETAINPLPIILVLLAILIMNALLPEKFYGRFKKRFEEVSMNDILIIVLVAGVILLVVSVAYPRFVSYRYTSMATPAMYFDLFIRNSSNGYYWFVLWSVVGYWLVRKKGRKVSSLLSIIFLAVAYLLFMYIP